MGELKPKLLQSYEASINTAKTLSTSRLIPEEFQNKPADVLIALDIAQRLGLSPFEVLNGITIIKGRPTFRAQFAISLAHIRGAFKSRISYTTEGSGEALRVTALVTLNNGREASSSVSMSLAKHEGWSSRNPKYRHPDMAVHMLKLRAATFLIRTHCPEILLGMHTTQEIEDIKDERELQKEKINEINAKLLSK